MRSRVAALSRWAFLLLASLNASPPYRTQRMDFAWLPAPLGCRRQAVRGPGSNISLQTAKLNADVAIQSNATRLEAAKIGDTTSA